MRKEGKQPSKLILNFNVIKINTNEIKVVPQLGNVAFIEPTKLEKLILIRENQKIEIFLQIIDIEKNKENEVNEEKPENQLIISPYKEDIHTYYMARDSLNEPFFCNFIGLFAPEAFAIHIGFKLKPQSHFKNEK